MVVYRGLEEQAEMQGRGDNLMGASQMAMDAMVYVRDISPILLILGGVSFADITILFLVRLIKQGRIKFK
jgi:hypothetical protein